MDSQIGPEGTASVVLNASGNGTAKVGPLSAREKWSPNGAHVSCATNTKEAQCAIYAGTSVYPNTFRDATLSGSTGDSTDRVSNDQIGCGEYIFAVWSGGDANTRATLNVTGEKTI
jgi:hypothetical protein